MISRSMTRGSTAAISCYKIQHLLASSSWWFSVDSGEDRRHCVADTSHPWTELGQPFAAREFVHLSAENREKSRSVVQTVAPCSSAIAARTASMTSGPAAWPSRTRRRRMSQCRSPGSRMPAAGWASQEEIAASASDVESGRSNTRGFVAILKKAHSVSQAKRTRSGPESTASSQARLFSCCSALG
jgi:hypothetical protein